ncbi:MAG: hypothetical protein AB7Q81_10730 [Gammaproteobacteria bacterium]
MKGLQWHWIALWAVLMVVIAQPLGDFEVFGLRYYRFGFIEIVGRVVAALTLLLGMVLYAGLGWPLAVNRFARLLAVVLLVWEVGLNADVAYVSFRAANLCAHQGGMHIKQRVVVTGFEFGGDIEYWGARGFAYLERRYVDYYGNEALQRFELEDGKRVVSTVKAFESRYKVTGGSAPAGYGIERHDAAIRDRLSGEAIGEWVTFKIKPGWADRLVLVFLPRGDHAHWTCGDEAPDSAGSFSHRYQKRVYSVADLITATLQPFE